MAVVVVVVHCYSSLLLTFIIIFNNHKFRWLERNKPKQTGINNNRIWNFLTEIGVSEISQTNQLANLI